MQGQRKLLALTPEHTVQDAVALCRVQAISQIPIIEGDRSVGSIQEVTLARLLHDGPAPEDVKLRGFMARPLLEVDATIALDEVYRLLMAGHTGVLVRRGGRIAGIITRIDLVEYWDRPPASAADSATTQTTT